MAAGRELEILVAKIQAHLAPDAEVLHDIRLPGRKSGRDRQIDVLVRQRLGQYEMLVVLDCKDYAKRVDVKGVEEFYGLVDDVGAQKGVLVCPEGFTEAAKTRAIGYQIDLYSPVDTDAHKWQARVAVPMVCDFRSAALSFSVSCRAPVPFSMNGDFFSSIIAHSDDRKAVGTPLETAIDKWNNGLFPTEPAEHRDLAIFDTPEVLVDNGYGMLVPVTLTASIYVRKQLFFGHLPLEKITGFRDELSGKIITNAFTTGIFDPNDVFENWTPFETEDELPVQPAMQLQGLIAWEA